MKLYLVIIHALILTGLQLIGIVIYSQNDDDINHDANRFQVEGYVKGLQTLKFGTTNEVIAGNLIHNRLNFHFRSTSKLTGALELRNRIFWGEEIKLTPNFSKLLGDSNEFLPLSFVWVDKPGLVGHTNVDRVWGEYKDTNFEIRLGRQRINWGIATTFNPNDIFNTYNFLDFDYEERPGSDALKTNFRLGLMSNLELALALSQKARNSVMAIKYFFNKNQYDYQLVGGVFDKTLTFGGGWSGAIGNMGFKGEIQYFTPHKEKDAVLNICAEADYLISNGWYLNGGVLYYSLGYYRPLDDWQSVPFTVSPRYLMPTKWNGVMTVKKQITPLFSGNLTTVYSPGTNLLITMPSLQYNMATNLDFDVVLQSFFVEEKNKFITRSQQLFFRIKLSF